MRESGAQGIEPKVEWEQPLYAVTVYVHAESAEAAKREVGKLGSRHHPEGIWFSHLNDAVRITP